MKCYHANESEINGALPSELQHLLSQCILENGKEGSVAQEEEECYQTEKLTFSFQELLLQYIDEKQQSDTDIYKKACIDRRLFSKIRSDENYHPSFRTVTLLALALELDIEQYEKLLHAAAYSLPKNKREYVVLRYCFEHRIYDFKQINTYLSSACQKSINSL